MLVTVNVQVPHDLSDKARDALETFRDATAGPDPRAEVLKNANG
jgi:molecular chaperone DnaJ